MNNKLTLDGMPFIEPNPKNKLMYVPSKNKFTTQVELDKAYVDSQLESMVFSTAPGLGLGSLVAELPGKSMTFAKAVDVISKSELDALSCGFLSHGYMMSKFFGEIPKDATIRFLDTEASLDKLYWADIGTCTTTPSKKNLTKADIEKLLDLDVFAYAADPHDSRLNTLYTGDKVFDELVNGFVQNEVSVITGPHGSGKSRLVDQIALGISIHEDCATLVIDGDAIGPDRAYEIDKGITNYKAYINEDLFKSKTFISELRKLLDSTRYNAVFINVPNLFAASPNTNPYNELADTTHNLRMLCKEFNVAAIVSCQSKRDSLHNDDFLMPTGSPCLVSLANKVVGIRGLGTGISKIKMVKSRDYHDLSKSICFDPCFGAFFNPVTLKA